MTIARSVARSVARRVASSPIRGGGGLVPDEDALAYIAAVESADDEALEIGVRNAINSFVVGCKNDDNWAAIASAHLICAGRTLAGITVPLKGTAGTLRNFVIGDYSRTLGLLGDGIDKDILANRLDNADAQDDFHMAIWRTVAEGTVNIEASIGSGGAVNRDQIITSSTQRIYRCRAASGAITDTTRHVGYLGVSRDNSANYQYRYNGTNATVTAASAVGAGQQISVFSRSGISYSTARISFYSIGAAIDQAALNSRLASFMFALSESIV